MTRPGYGRIASGNMFVKTIGVIALGITCLMMGGRAHACSDVDCGHPNHPVDIPDRHQDCGVHNMMVVGAKTIFLSHLPMFRSEHRFQVLLEATFSKNGKSHDDIYAKDRKDHPHTKMYTVAPAGRFVLSRMFAPETLSQRRDAFPGTVYRGHLERGGEPISGLTDVGVTITRVIYAQELRPTDKKSDTLDYLLFGKPDDLYLAHRITHEPDFDQIVSVTVKDHRFTDAELDRGVMITIPHRKNAAASRLRTDETVAAAVQRTEAEPLLPLSIRVDTEYYFEEGELFVPAKFPPTPLETEAGF
jgi:hypothetical protein